MDLGLTVNDDCLTTYNELKKDKKHRYIIYSTLNQKTIQIEKVGNRDATYEEFLDNLPKNDSRYCIFDYQMKYPDGRVADKIIYVFWCPDNAPVKVKMVSASTNQFFQNKVQGFAVAFQCNDLSALEAAEIEKKLN